MKNILKISDGVAIAIHALNIMSKDCDRFYSVKEMAESLDVSYNHLSKIMQKLVKKDFVKSKKGNKGGFYFVKNPKQIYLFDIYEAIDGSFCPCKCLLNRESCNHNCNIGKFLCSINSKVEEFFKSQNITDF